MKESPQDDIDTAPKIDTSLIESSGLSNHYRTVMTGLQLAVSLGYLDLLRNVIELIKSHPIPTYEEHCTTQGYDNIVNDKNRVGVEKLDAIVEEVNEIIRGTQALTAPKDFPVERFNRLMEEFDRIIRGDTPHG